MNLFGFELNVRKAAEPKKPRAGVEIGASGTNNYEGIITEEYNSKLSGTQGITVYEEMRKSDATVRAALQATYLPIRRAEWFIEPASEDQADKDIADFVSNALFDYMSITWEDLLRQALLCLPFGVMAFEKVFEIRNVDGVDRVIWRKFAPRLPKTIYAWQMENGEDGIQQTIIEGGIVSIPMEKLLVFVHEKEGDNWWGTSVLRPAYKHWYIKTTIEKIDAIAIERQGLGIPFVKLPENYTEDDRAKAKTILENLRAHEKAYIIEPTDWEVAFKDMMARSTRDPMPSIQYHNREIMKSVLAQFLELGAATSKGSGSRAVSADHSELFLKGLEAIADSIKDAFNKYAIPQLVDFNFSNVTDYPELAYTGISKVEVDKLATAYSSLVTTGAIQVIDKDEQYLREVLDLPEKTEDDEPRERPQDQNPNDPQNNQNKKDAGVPGKNGKKKASETVSEFKPWRKLTFAEGKVDFGKLQDTFDRLQEKFATAAKDMLDEEREAYMAALATAVNDSDAEAVKSLTFKIKKDYRDLVKDMAREAFETGKNSAAKEMDVERPSNPRDFMRQLDILADTIAEQHITEIVTTAKTGLVEGLSKGETKAATIGAVDAILAKKIAELTTDTADILMGGYINYGRRAVFDAYASRIYALQRSEILDFHTCFPAGTKIRTAAGQKNIEDVVKGELVLTREGYRRVIETMHRDYSGPMVEVSTDSVNFICTADHPVFANGFWVEARDLRVGDNLLHARSDIAYKVGAFVYRLLGQSQHLEAVLRKIGIFSRISAFVPVPVRSVRLYTNINAMQQKVDGVSANMGFLSELKTSLLNGLADILFQPRLSHVAAVASNGAEVIVGSRDSAEGKTTGSTGFYEGRAAAELRAVKPSWMPVESIAASGASLANDVGVAAIPRAERVARVIRPGNAETALTSGTDFGNRLSGVSTFYRAKCTPVAASPVGGGEIEGFAANSTRACFAGAFGKNLTMAFPRAVLRFARGVFFALKRLLAVSTEHVLYSSTKLHHLVSLQVYNLEVEGVHEYFANGLLVHNCNYCLSIDGRIVEKEDPFARNTIFHSNCRGIWVEILNDEEDKPSIGGIPQSLRDRFGDAVNDLLQPRNPIVRKDSLASKFLNKSK